MRMIRRSWLSNWTKAITLSFFLGVFLLVLPAGGTCWAKTLKIGVLLNLEFPLGVMAKNYLDAYIPALNAKGGLEIGGKAYTIEPVLYNTKGTSEGGRAAAERAVYRDKVKFITGEESVEAWLPLTESNKVVVVATTPTEGIFNKNYQYSFQGSVLQSQAVVLWGWFSQKYPQIKNFLTAYPDSTAGQAEDRKAAAFAKAFGMQKGKSIFYLPGTTDFSAIATKIVRENPQMFSTAAGGPLQDSLLIKALHEAGYKGLIFSQTTIPLAEIIKIVPVKVVEGMITAMTALHLEEVPSAFGKEVKAAYISKFGKWDDPDPLFFDSFRVLTQGIQQAQSIDPEKVAAHMRGTMKFEGTAGPAMLISHPELGCMRSADVLNTAYIQQVIKGKSTLIDTVPLQKAYEYCKTFYGWK